MEERKSKTHRMEQPGLQVANLNALEGFLISHNRRHQITRNPRKSSQATRSTPTQPKTACFISGRGMQEVTRYHGTVLTAGLYSRTFLKRHPVPYFTLVYSGTKCLIPERTVEDTQKILLWAPNKPTCTTITIEQLL